MKQQDRSSERNQVALDFAMKTFFLFVWSSPPNLRAKSIPKKDNTGFGAKYSPDRCRIPNSSGLGCVSVPSPKFLCPPPPNTISSSVARGGGGGGARAPHWLVKYAKSHFLLLLRLIFCEKLKIAPPHWKTAQPQTFKFPNLAEKSVSISVKTIFFWRPPHFGRKKPLTFWAFREISSDKPCETVSRTMKIWVKVVCTFLTLSKKPPPPPPPFSKFWLHAWQSPPASPSGSSTNVPATCLERRMEAAQSIRTRDSVAHSWVNHHQLLLGNWNILTLTGKELELVEEAKRYHLDIIGVSSTKRRGSGTVDLDGGWKLFYSGADPSMSAQAGVGILTSPRLSDCVSDWILLGSRVYMLKLKVLDRSLCLLQVNAPQCHEWISDFCGWSKWCSSTSINYWIYSPYGGF